MFFIRNILNQQQLKRLSINGVGSTCSSSQNPVLEEFNRILKVNQGEITPDKLSREIGYIRYLLDDAARFSQLNQVLVNEDCYFIYRKANGKIYISPCNKLVHETFKDE